MAYISLAVDAPHATAYDEAYPTRSTENYAHALHEILQDMDDAAGDWYLSDGVPTLANFQTIRGYICALIEYVFNYAEQAIDSYRSGGTPTLAKPTDTLLPTTLTLYAYPEILNAYMKVYVEAYKTAWFIYYMWKTEEDPLLLKEKLQELLIAWPLTDTEIILQEEGGQSLRVHPAWKNVDI